PEPPTSDTATANCGSAEASNRSLPSLPKRWIWVMSDVVWPVELPLSRMVLVRLLPRMATSSAPSPVIVNRPPAKLTERAGRMRLPSGSITGRSCFGLPLPDDAGRRAPRRLKNSFQKLFDMRVYLRSENPSFRPGKSLYRDVINTRLAAPPPDDVE